VCSVETIALPLGCRRIIRHSRYGGGFAKPLRGSAPWQEATPQRTLDILDLPQYYVDVYGVRNVQFQSNHVAQNNDNPDLSYIRELRAKLDAAGAKAHQINLEIGTMVAQLAPDGKAAALAGDARAAWLERAKKWVDLSPVLGVTRLMHNQGALTDDSKAGVTSLWKDLRVDAAAASLTVVTNWSETLGR
jgi:hypothetical protein